MDWVKVAGWCRPCGCSAWRTREAGCDVASASASTCASPASASISGARRCRRWRNRRSTAACSALARCRHAHRLSRRSHGESALRYRHEQRGSAAALRTQHDAARADMARHACRQRDRDALGSGDQRRQAQTARDRVPRPTCRNRARLKEFIEIAQVGGGEAFLTTDEQQIVTQLMILVFGSQYDNANSGVGIARDINNGRPFRRLKPTQYGFSLFNQRYAGTPGASACSRGALANSIVGPLPMTGRPSPPLQDWPGACRRARG